MTAHHRPDAPADLARWGLHAFALGARSTPQRIVAMDDNGSLLFHARRGLTFDQLAAHGIRPSASQLALLQAYRLITVQDDLISTAFPVVGPRQLAELRPRTADLAAALSDVVHDDVAAIADALAGSGHREHLHTVVFGHAVDGLLWDELKAAELVPTTRLSIERPFWNGVFWAIHPARPGSAGVNEVPGPAATLVMVWTDGSKAALNAFAASPRAAALLADPIGQQTVPVVRPEVSDPVHGPSLRLTGAIADAFHPGGAAQPLLDAIDVADRQQQVVIVAHELIWDLMETWQRAGTVIPPPVDEPTIGEAAVLRQLLLRLPD